MNYEMAVLAALVQLDKPTRPKITEATGISAKRVNTAINHLKDLLDIGIYWYGAKIPAINKLIHGGLLKAVNPFAAKPTLWIWTSIKRRRFLSTTPCALRSITPTR